MKLSICIPTYNRAKLLANCLQSIVANQAMSAAEFQVCVSNNHSTDETESVVRAAQGRIDIKYWRNPRNLGVARNFLDVVQMADGDFVWLIGDDDLLFPYSIGEVCALIEQHPGVDFFYVNSCHLAAEYVLSFPQPFDFANLPAKMEPFSSWPESRPLKFLELVDPRISFDFLMGMYLAVFRREKWMAHAGTLDAGAIADERVFSHFDNTCPHLKIFSRAFAKSDAYLHVKPVSISLAGAREWAPMYPLVRSVRIIEALDEYRKNGLPLVQYLNCKNHALGHFLPDLAYMFLNRTRSGYEYINPARLILSNLSFPNFYLSAIYYCLRKFRGCVP